MTTGFNYHLDALSSVADLDIAVTAAVADLVRGARQRGATWEDVGRALGVSRQAAHHRFAGMPDMDPQGAEDVPTSP